MAGSVRAFRAAALYDATPALGMNGWVKSTVERAVALVLLLAAAPVMALVAVAVRCSGAGPLIHRRRVLGRHGAEFFAFKFRTMVADADERLQGDPRLKRAFEVSYKLQQDPRVTRVGGLLRRCSLDELPQLFNVLRGEMALVGPRMISPQELAKYGADGSRLLSVKPGLTGLWQVSGRHQMSYDERVRLDMQYIERWSLWLDLQIFLRTIPAVLNSDGAY
jgi:lipopolysaccharide/colanic/teichoic acid biosynthesis glycosyltransferase